MNKNVITNFDKLKLSLFFIPFCLLVMISIFLYVNHSLNVSNYVKIQKDVFYDMNNFLGQYPNFEYNLTQIGDASIFLSFIIFLILYTPKIWESLLTASLASLIFSFTLKRIFSVPRPAQVFDNNTFIITGKAIVGNSSLPSGHALTMVTILTILMYGFMPKGLINRIFYKIMFLLIALLLISTRVGVGAHYPLDVLIGGIIGYICGLIGIFVSRKYGLGLTIKDTIPFLL
jgi:membrane-associated phospholipid phosphatase